MKIVIATLLFLLPVFGKIPFRQEIKVNTTSIYMYEIDPDERAKQFNIKLDPTLKSGVLLLLWSEKAPSIFYVKITYLKNSEEKTYTQFQQRYEWMWTPIIALIESFEVIKIEVVEFNYIDYTIYE